MIDYRAIATRIYECLEDRGWSARELSRRAWGEDTAKGSNALAGLRRGAKVELDTLHAMARALSVSDEWLIYGRGEGPRASAAPTPPATAAPDDSATDDAEHAKALPPGCLAQNPNYSRSKKVARRLASEVDDEWVWDDLDTVDTLFLGTREPSPQVLADLARLIQKHGKPR